MKQVCQDDLAEKNIRAIYDREQEAIRKSPVSHRVAHKVAAFSGTVLFLVINILIFSAWIGFNVLSPWKLDPYPFTFLTMAVSLESIVLASFVLISQNAAEALSERRHNLDLQVNLLHEAESTALILVVIDMARKMGIEEHKLEQLKQMSIDTDPEEVLKKIEEIEGNQ